MIELTILEPSELSITTLIDRDRLTETIEENLPHVATDTLFVVNGEVIATKGEN